MNASLQQKKNKLRSLLKSKGILKKEGTNAFDKYKYFSEAQYKELFTDLFSTCGLELKADTVDYEAYGGSDKQPNGRKVTVEFSLIDIDTGFYESSRIVGEGLDKGDKGGYKAYTGALKYYLASTFAVATGDEAEKDSLETTATPKARKPKPVGSTLIDDFRLAYSDTEREGIRQYCKVDTDEQIPLEVITTYVKRRQGIIEDRHRSRSGLFD